MRLALLVLGLFIVALAATTKKEGKRQINHYLPYYGTNNVIEPRQFRPTRTATVTQISTLTYTFTCVKSTTACPSSSTSTSITPTPTSSATSSTTATSATATSATATSATATSATATSATATSATATSATATSATATSATATSATATSATATSATATSATATSATATSATATSATATSATATSATATSATATSATATSATATRATATSATATSATATSATATSATDTATASGTVGRRRRGIDIRDVEAQDWVNEQLSIVPSNVQGVEATQAPVREGREAAAQFAYSRRLGMIPPFGYYDPQEIQPGFDNDPTLALPYYGSYVQPAAITQPRIFFGALNALFPGYAVTRTETITSFTIVAKTLTSSPTCVPPGIVQCAA